MATTYDYIIAGAGTSGCVLAARLTRDPDIKVLLLEAGGSEKHPLISMPLAWFEAMRKPSFGWGYGSEPEPFADGRIIPAPRGRLIGGCSSINGMMYSRGHPADYDQWAQMGARGWSHADVLPYFLKSESNWRGASEHHGGSGELTVSRHKTDGYIYPRLIETAEHLGFRHLDDFHGEDREGFSAPDFTVHKGRRGSTAARFLRPAMRRPNLTVETQALTTRIIIKNKRAVGLEYLQAGNLKSANATGEVIIAAGTFNSPQILMLSGIGPADDLRAVGIDPIHDLPGVGANLQEHGSIALLFEASGHFTFDRALRADRFGLSLLQWQLFGTGAPAGLPIGAQGFIRTREGLELPDNQMLISPVAMDGRIWFPGVRKRRGDIFSISNVLLRPESRGRVSLRSSDPLAKPRILFNLLSTENDRSSFRRFVRFTRDFFAQAPASEMVSREIIPGPAVQSDPEIDAFIRARIGTAMHPTSTCAIGQGIESVVDEKLRVHGIDGLRIVDCSVMPTIVGGNTQAAAIMIAEKAADMILGQETEVDAVEIVPRSKRQIEA